MSRYSYRRTTPREAIAAAAAGLVLVAAAGPGHHHGHAAPAAALTAASGSYTPASWARALLTSAGLPRTRCNLAAITAWEAAEGGQWANNAQYNPLNTTEPAPGSWVVNSAGVRAYPSWRAGLDATITTLRNGNYPAIVAALRSGADAQAVADAVASSPWGTSAFPAAC